MEKNNNYNITLYTYLNLKIKRELLIKLKTADRISRLIVVFTLVSFIIFSLKIIFKFYSSSFSNIYLGRLLISSSQIISVTLIIIALVILFVTMVYCYNELRAFSGNEETTEKLKVDQKYLMIFDIIQASFLTFLSILIIRLIIMPVILYLEKSNVLFFTILIIMNLIFLYVSNFITNNYRSEKIIKRITLFIISKKNYFIVLSVWLIFAPLFILVGLYQFSNPVLNIGFTNSTKKNSPEVHFNFSDRIPDKMPEKIDILILSSNKDTKFEISVSQSEFIKTFTEVRLQNNQDNTFSDFFKSDDNSFEIKKSNYSLYKRIKLPDLKSDGSLVITFNENNPLENKKSYKIVNDFYIENNKFHFNEPSIKVNLK